MAYISENRKAVLSSLEHSHAVPIDGPIAEKSILARAEKIHAAGKSELHRNIDKRRAILRKSNGIV